MCEELEEELQKGDTAIRDLAHHLFSMGASSLTHDQVYIPETEDRFIISVKRVPK